jgi:hypothetical protein
MYPYLFDSNGKTQLATSDGLSDEHGHFLWRNRAEGFSRTVPLHGGNGQIFFVDYETQDRVELRRADGAVSWSMKLPAEDVGMYKSLDGTELPFVITGYRDARKVTVFNLLGGISQVIAMPEWAASVQSIAWPNPGNLLVGAGDWLAVIDPNGREVFKHVIQNTSFAPYHGPDGVVVHFKPNAPPFLVVASHGSSGFARSVILIFDAKGTLVWQRETDRISSLVSVPIAAEGREVLWTGGMDAITEYSLSPSAQH